MWCSVGQALDGSKPISSVCCREEDLSNIKLWREVNSSHGALLLLSMCFPYASLPLIRVVLICIKCVSVGQCSHAECACSRHSDGKRVHAQSSATESREEATILQQQCAWEGKKEGV
ncbi:hypothetical protein QQF64_003272 [Cirrhinus molitorella]|uniref:Uncharacterized protein n=1 Tax=Cirrhinus molitorella TaxID=172907 RepID=A0ABR3MJP8_9TELE